MRESCCALTSATRPGATALQRLAPGPASATPAARRPASGPSASAPAAGSRATCPTRWASPPGRRGRPGRPRPPRAGPGRNRGKPNSSLSAPSTSAARATGTRGTRPSAAPRSSEICVGGGGSSSQASDTGWRPYRPPRSAPRCLRRFVAELLQRREREVPDAEILVRDGAHVGRGGHRHLVPDERHGRGLRGDRAVDLAPRAARAAGSVSVRGAVDRVVDRRNVELGDVRVADRA